MLAQATTVRRPSTTSNVAADDAAANHRFEVDAAPEPRLADAIAGAIAAAQTLLDDFEREQMARTAAAAQALKGRIAEAVTAAEALLADIETEQRARTIAAAAARLREADIEQTARNPRAAMHAQTLCLAAPFLSRRNLAALMQVCPTWNKAIQKHPLTRGVIAEGRTLSRLPRYAPDRDAQLQVFIKADLGRFGRVIAHVPTLEERLLAHSTIYKALKAMWGKLAADDIDGAADALQPLEAAFGPLRDYGSDVDFVLDSHLDSAFGAAVDTMTSALGARESARRGQLPALLRALQPRMEAVLQDRLRDRASASIRSGLHAR